MQSKHKFEKKIDFREKKNKQTLDQEVIQNDKVIYTLFCLYCELDECCKTL